MRQRYRARQKLRGSARYRSVFVVLILLALTASAAHGGSAEVSGVYRAAASIRSLSLEQLARRYPAQVRGVVTQSTDDGLVIQDATAGIWVYWNRSDDFSIGDEVEVKGEVDPGLFAPSIRALSVDKLGRAPLPKPKQVTLAELNAGEDDCQYVSVTGTVLSAGLRKGASEKQKLWLRIAVEHGVVNATFPAEDSPEAAKLIDAVVRIDAPAMGTKNDNRQITSSTLSVAGIGNVIVLRPAPADLLRNRSPRSGGLCNIDRARITTTVCGSREPSLTISPARALFWRMTAKLCSWRRRRAATSNLATESRRSASPLPIVPVRSCAMRFFDG